MKQLVLVLGIFVLGLLVLSSVSIAQHGGHGGMGSSAMKMETREVLAEGVKMTFQIMANDEHRKMLKEMKMKEDVEPGTTHNITLTLKDEKTQKEITDAQVSLKVIDPKGKDQIKEMKYEGAMKSFDAYFDLPDRGKYQVIVLVKKAGHNIPAGIFYEVK
jgi:hypothetical protein